MIAFPVPLSSIYACGIEGDGGGKENEPTAGEICDGLLTSLSITYRCSCVNAELSQN